jgi:hypothetical protein
MNHQVDLLKELMFGLLQAQAITSVNSSTFKLRAKRIAELQGIIEKAEKRPLFNRIFTAKKVTA